MKKLYMNIRDINIKGDPSLLSEVVSVMDVSLQNIAVKTQQLVNQLNKYGASNKGHQYAKVVSTSIRLRDELYQASYDLNDMQNQIVQFQNKIFRYEEMAERAQKPNSYMVDKYKNIVVETSMVQFNREDMLSVAAMLKNYKEAISYHIKKINDKKNSIGGVWKDRQYNDFASFIEEVIKNVNKALGIFDEYVFYLEKQIKELD